MRVDLHSIQRLVDFELPPVSELVSAINSRLGGVEEVIDLGKKYSGAILVKIKSVEKHPDADKLNICMVDDGGVNQDVDRNEFGLVQVVCGAPNARADMMAVWLPPSVTVPASYNDAKPFVLDRREIRGVMSNGMLAAADELAIGTDHSGIIEISVEDFQSEELVSNDGKGIMEELSLDDLIGTSFADVFGLHGSVIDIENKMFTHRPDLFGQLGVAREIAGITHKKFTEPDWYKTLKPAQEASSLQLSVSNDCPDLVPRFAAVCMDGVTVKDSPMWLKTALVAMGGKPINNIVDITNYIMLMTSQPVHAYDYDKLYGNSLGVRNAKAKESITLLNNKTYELDPNDLVIVDGKGPVGLAGVMGGGDSEVSRQTSKIVIECATFDMYAVRRMSMRHGIFTDAVSRFNKGQSPAMNLHVLQYLVALATDISGAKIASNIYDITADDVASENSVGRPMVTEAQTSVSFINARLGLNLSFSEITILLENVGFAIESVGKEQFTYKAPKWRTDIKDAEDVVEEVGRLYGFDNLPKVLPRRSIKPAPINKNIEIKRLIRDAMKRYGANEVLTYSFVHEKVIIRAEQDASDAYSLSNALSPELQYYRLSVLPSLLDKVRMNIKAGHDEFVLYEIGKGHHKDIVCKDDGLPEEYEMVDAVYASKKPKPGAAYYHMRSLLSKLMSYLGVDAKLSVVSRDGTYPQHITAPFDLGRSAIMTTTDGQFIGIVGELKGTVARSFKLPDFVAAMSLDLANLKDASSTSTKQYKPLSRFPSISQDISLKVSARVPFTAVEKIVDDVIGEQEQDLDMMVIPLTIYKEHDDSEFKTISFRLKVTHHSKTLRESQVSKILDQITNEASKKINAERV